MGVDTKGFIATACKDVAVIGILVEGALRAFITEEMRTRYPERTQRALRMKEFSMPQVELSQRMSVMSFNFKLNDEKRSLKLFTTCDCDNTKRGVPQSLSLTLGCWGESPTMMKLALHALSVLGTPWYDENDCDSIDIAPWPQPRITIVQALGFGYIDGYDFPELVAAFDRGALPGMGAFIDVFGMSREEFELLEAIKDFKERMSAYEEFGRDSVQFARREFYEEFQQARAALEERAAQDKAAA